MLISTVGNWITVGLTVRLGTTDEWRR
jgi:hypothetical protein